MRAKAKECEDLVEKKEAIVMASFNKSMQKRMKWTEKVETNLNAIEETKAAIETALWSGKNHAKEEARSKQSKEWVFGAKTQKGQQKCIGRTTLNKKRPGEPPRGSLEKAANTTFISLKFYYSHIAFSFFLIYIVQENGATAEQRLFNWGPVRVMREVMAASECQLGVAALAILTMTMIS
ncbi:hypothetical protein Fmac_005341 [Flemingia macrophylla]|uniref:Uncharacterized protein n=1 Tax=Flemingia macrophylla TaxID=520843 RepID=A0ABD1N824_9FABA